MNNKLQNAVLGLIIILGIVLCVVLLASPQEEQKGTSKGTTKATEASTAPIINAPTTAIDIQEKMVIITMVNEDAGLLSFRAVEDGENINFAVEKAITIHSAYGTAMTMPQLTLGEVAYITYDAVSHTLQDIKMTNDVWEKTKVSAIEINQADETMYFYNKLYEYDSNLVIVSGDKLISPLELTDKDSLRVFGINGKIISIIVDKGHGYVSLSGVDLFMGGYVDVGNVIIKTIEKDMIVLVTEGKYDVTVSHNGYVASKTIEVTRDMVTNVDFSEIVAETFDVGNVFFDINVDDAVLYLNGEKTDYSEGIITLPVGRYSVKVTADGFDTYTDVVEIIADYQKINIKMKSEETETTTTEAETTTGQSTTAGESVTSQYETESATVVSTTNKVYIDEPTGASIYFDGTYMGIAPLNFAMVTGSHVITVLDGYEVRTYSVNLAEGGDDVRYDFSKK